VTGVWILVAVVGATTILLKGLGPVALGGRPLPPRLLGVVNLFAPALLAALVVTQVFASQQKLALDARVVGLLAAVAALVLRAPILVVIVVAAAATALARAIA